MKLENICGLKGLLVKLWGMVFILCAYSVLVSEDLYFSFQLFLIKVVKYTLSRLANEIFLVAFDRSKLI